MEWSKRSNECPLCKAVFYNKYILIKPEPLVWPLCYLPENNNKKLLVIGTVLGTIGFVGVKFGYSLGQKEVINFFNSIIIFKKK